MKHDMLGLDGLAYEYCQYGLSRLRFRGPRKDLSDGYIACIGGSETFGKFLETPYPDLIQLMLRRTCLNLGCVNAGLDAYLRDSAAMALCHDADATILQIMGAQNLSNRFYSVHPRRNDRFVAPSAALTTLYPDVDFADFAFTRHMLSVLELTSPDRFAVVKHELQSKWMQMMRAMLQELRGPAVLFWLADHEVGETPNEMILRDDPLFVTPAMIDALTDQVAAFVSVVPTIEDRIQGARGMVYTPDQAQPAAHMLGMVAQEQAASDLTAVLRNIL